MQHSTVNNLSRPRLENGCLLREKKGCTVKPCKIYVGIANEPTLFSLSLSRGVYRSEPIFRNHLVYHGIPSLAVYPGSKPKKYNPPVSGAHAPETLPAIIHARRMLFPEYNHGWHGVHVWAVCIASIGQFLPAGKRPCVCPVPRSCPRIQECMRKYDITHGKVPGHLCRVNY